jgi:hypothetical protein
VKWMALHTCLVNLDIHIRCCDFPGTVHGVPFPFLFSFGFTPTPGPDLPIMAGTKNPLCTGTVCPPFSHPALAVQGSITPAGYSVHPPTKNSISALSFFYLLPSSPLVLSTPRFLTENVLAQLVHLPLGITAASPSLKPFPSSLHSFITSLTLLSVFDPHVLAALHLKHGPRGFALVVIPLIVGHHSSSNIL